MTAMTIKQLAEFFGKSDDTIRRAAKRLGSKAINGMAQTFDRAQVEAISESVFPTVPAAVREAIAYTFANAQGEPSANAKVLLAKLVELKAQYAAMVAKVKSLEASPVRLALPAPVTDAAIVREVRLMAESGKLSDPDVRRLLNLDTGYTPPKIPRGDYIIGTIQDLTDRLFNVPFWPVRYTTLAKHLKLRDELTYRVARMCKVNPDEITAEGAMKIARLITCTPEPKALPGDNT